LACFGENFPFRFAHRCFIASEMRLRAAGLIRRRFPQSMAPLADVHAGVQVK
jgi:hypothetical protein